MIDDIDSMCFKFIWNSNSNSKKVIEKIKRSVMCLKVENGGASMLKLCDQQSLFQLKWIKRTVILKNSLLNATGISDLYFSWFGNEDYFLGFSCSEDKIVFPKLYSRFWKEVFCNFLKHKDNIISSTNEIEMSKINPSSNATIFYNKNITYKNEVLFFKSWIKAGLKFTSQLMSGPELKTYREISDLVGPSPNLIFEYNAIKNSSFKNNTNVSQGINPIECVKNALLRFFAQNNKKQRNIISKNKNN